MMVDNYKYVKQINHIWIDYLLDIFKYGFVIASENNRIRKSVERALLNAGIGFPISNEGTKFNKIILELPKILIDRTNGLSIKIGNSLKYQERLMDIDISSALNGYVVEYSYLLEDRQFYVFECEPVNVDYQLTFEKFKDFKEFVNGFENNGQIMIDKRLVIPYSHMILTGATGSGKTTALYYLMLFVELRHGKKHLFVIDPKQEALLEFAELRKYKKATETNEILPLLRRFLLLMDKRKAEMRKVVKKCRKFDSDALEFGFAPYFLFVDELAALNATLNKDERNEFYSLLTRVILMGRSLGFYVVISLQQNNAKELSTALKEQIGFKVVLGNSGKQSYMTLFDDLDGAGGLIKQKKKIGEGVYVSSLNGQMSLKKLRFPHLEFLG